MYQPPQSRQDDSDLQCSFCATMTLVRSLVRVPSRSRTLSTTRLETNKTQAHQLVEGLLHLQRSEHRDAERQPSHSVHARHDRRLRLRNRQRTGALRGRAHDFERQPWHELLSHGRRCWCRGCRRCHCSPGAQAVGERRRGRGHSTPRVTNSRLVWTRIKKNVSNRKVSIRLMHPIKCHHTAMLRHSSRFLFQQRN